MDLTTEYREILEKLQALDALCRDLLAVSDCRPCLERNTRRILSSVEMLKLDFPDISDMA